MARKVEMSWLVISLVGGSRRIKGSHATRCFLRKIVDVARFKLVVAPIRIPLEPCKRKDSTTKCDRIRVVERKSVFFMPMLRNASPDDAFNYFPNSLAMRPM
jgi:hypothetical protein